MTTSCRKELLTKPDYQFATVAKYIEVTPQHLPMAKVGLDEIEGTLVNFTRVIDGIMIPADGIRYALNGLKYPIERISQYIKSGSTPEFSAKDACVFVYHALSQYKELIAMAEELDAEINNS